MNWTWKLLPKTLYPGTQEDKTSLAHLSEAACESSSSKEEKSEIVRRDHDIDEEQRIYFQVQIKDNQTVSESIFFYFIDEMEEFWCTPL